MCDMTHAYEVYVGYAKQTGNGEHGKAAVLDLHELLARHVLGACQRERGRERVKKRDRQSERGACASSSYHHHLLGVYRA